MKHRITLIVFFFLIAAHCMPGLSPASAEVVDRIAAIVNDEIVTQVDIEKEAAPYLKNIAASGYSKAQKQMMAQKVQQEVLTALIERSLTMQEAKRYGISISERDVDMALENIKKMKSFSQEAFEEALRQEGMTLAEYREQIKSQILRSKIINVAVRSKVVITDSDVKTYYEKHRSKFEGKKKYHLRNILMTDLDEIRKVKKKIEADQDFASLAKEFSVAPNAPEGGDLGLFDISNFSEKIKESILKLDIGGHTPVIETAQGFQLFYLQKVIVEGQKSIEQATKEIQDTLYRERVEMKFNAWLETLKKNAHIKKM